jgi:virginiamycin A acetyltransferase
MMRRLVKGALLGIFLAISFPMAAASGFGRIEPVYYLFAQLCALAPGIVGDYLRIAYYRQTLTECDLSGRVQFGSFFSHPQVRLAERVYVGCYCVIGRCEIGVGTQIASGVKIASGKRQHERDDEGRIQGAGNHSFEVVKLGGDCWIGTGAVILADVGEKTTIGAGAVVVKPIPAGVTAVGNPARPMEGKGK